MIGKWSTFQRIEALGILFAIVTGIAACIVGIWSVHTARNVQDRQESFLRQQDEERRIQAAASLVLVQSDGYIGIQNYANLPVTDLAVSGPGETAHLVGSLPPCSEFRIYPDFEKQIIGDEKGPLPTVMFVDALGKGWQRDPAGETTRIEIFNGHLNLPLNSPSYRAEPVLLMACSR